VGLKELKDKLNKFEVGTKKVMEEFNSLISKKSAAHFNDYM